MTHTDDSDAAARRRAGFKFAQARLPGPDCVLLTQAATMTVTVDSDASDDSGPPPARPARRRRGLRLPVTVPSAQWSGPRRAAAACPGRRATLPSWHARRYSSCHRGSVATVTAGLRVTEPAAGMGRAAGRGI